MKTLTNLLTPKKPLFATVGTYFVMNVSTYKKYKNKLPLHFFSIHLDYNTEFVTIKQQCPVKKNTSEYFSGFVLDGEIVSLKNEIDYSKSSVRYGKEVSKEYERIMKRIFGNFTDTVSSDFDYCKLCKNQLACSFQSPKEIEKSSKEFQPISTKHDLIEKWK